SLESTPAGAVIAQVAGRTTAAAEAATVLRNLRRVASMALAEPIRPGPGDRRNLIRTELVILRPQTLRRLHRIVPSYFLPAVAGFAAKNAGHRRLGHVLRLIDWLAFANAGDQIGVLEFVGSALRTFEFPRAAAVRCDVRVAVALATGPGDELRNYILAV